MAIWTDETNPFGENRTPLLIGLSSDDGETPVPVAVDPVTGAILTESGSSVDSNVNLTQVGGSSITIGQSLSAASLPVVLPASQITTLTPPAAITNYAQEAGGNLASAVSNQTNGSQQTKLTGGTYVASVIPGDTGYNGVVAAGGAITYSFSTSATGAQVIGPYNCEGYGYVEVVYTSVGAGLANNGQFCPISNGTFNSSTTFQLNSGTGSALGVVVNSIYTSPVRGNYFQINVTAMTGGTTSGYVTFRNSPISIPPSTISPSANTVTTGSITTSSTAVTTGALTAGGFSEVSIHGTYAGVSFGITISDDSGTTFYPVSIYDAAAQAWLAPGSTITPGTNASKHYWVSVPGATTEIKVLASAYSSGTGSIRIVSGFTSMPPSDMTQIQDAAGNNRGANVTPDNALQVQQRFSYTHINTSTTTTVKSGSGFLHAISVNTLGTVASTTTIYDNTAGSGAVIGIINTLTLSGIFIMDVAFNTGLTIVTTGTVAPDITVSSS